MEQDGFKVDWSGDYAEWPITGSTFATYGLNEGRSYNFGRSGDSHPVLVYSFYDIDGDGLEELIVGGYLPSTDLAEQWVDGAGGGQPRFVQIADIYTLRDGQPMIVKTQPERHTNMLLRGVDGRCYIEDSYGRMDNYTFVFYTINERGNRVTLDEFHINGVDRESIASGRPVYFYSMMVDGEEVDLTEEEFLRLVGRYGSNGFAALGPDNEVVLVWKLVSAHD